MIFGSDGAMATAPIDKLPRLSVNGVQLSPLSDDFQSPPPAVPRYITDGFFGSIAIAETRPATFEGPIFRQFVPETGKALGIIIWKEETGKLLAGESSV